MRSDSIELPKEPLKPDPIRRVKPTRQKEREERRREFEELARKNTEPENSEEEAGKPETPAEGTEESPDSRVGRSPTRGKRLDVLV